MDESGHLPQANRNRGELRRLAGVRRHQVDGRPDGIAMNSSHPVSAEPTNCVGGCVGGNSDFCLKPASRRLIPVHFGPLRMTPSPFQVHQLNPPAPLSW